MSQETSTATGSRATRVALLVAVLLTGLVLGLDAANERSGLPESLRTAGATVTGPVLTAIAGTFPAPAARTLTETELSARLSLAEADQAASASSLSLLQTEHVTLLRESGHTVVLARVVAVGAVGPTGPERLTIDVGERDGIGLDQSIVSIDGLVGRTVRVGATTSDVLIIGSPDLVMGARADASGLLGTVGPPGTSMPAPRESGELTFTAIAFGELGEGEVLRTIGSPDNVPFVAGLPIGTVSRVDPSRGRVGVTAAVTPAVDVGRLDVVAVIVPGTSTDETGE